MVGDMIELFADEIIPADLLLVHTSSPDGICFVETANLDGETNLKQRTLFYERTETFDVSKFSSITCEPPNNRIYEFNGSTNLNNRDYSLDYNHMLLRGCILRHTPSIIGIVLYAGHTTKAMLNNSGPRSKRSKLGTSSRYPTRVRCECSPLAVTLVFVSHLR